MLKKPVQQVKQVEVEVKVEQRSDFSHLNLSLSLNLDLPLTLADFFSIQLAIHILAREGNSIV